MPSLPLINSNVYFILNFLTNFHYKQCCTILCFFHLSSNLAVSFAIYLAFLPNQTKIFFNFFIKELLCTPQQKFMSFEHCCYCLLHISIVICQKKSIFCIIYPLIVIHHFLTFLIFFIILFSFFSKILYRFVFRVYQNFVFVFTHPSSLYLPRNNFHRLHLLYLLLLESTLLMPKFFSYKFIFNFINLHLIHNDGFIQFH